MNARAQILSDIIDGQKWSVAPKDAVDIRATGATILQAQAFVTSAPEQKWISMVANSHFSTSNILPSTLARFASEL